MTYFVPAKGECDPLGAALKEQGGPRALKELQFRGLQPGEAVLRRAYGMKVAYIVATPAPTYDVATHAGVDAFSAALRSCMNVADEGGLASLCFGSWSLAVSGMPARLVAMTTYRVLDEWRKAHRRRTLKKIVLALHDRAGYEVFRHVARPSANSSVIALPNVLGEDATWKVDKVLF